jgi:hypothetical protein
LHIRLVHSRMPASDLPWVLFATKPGLFSSMPPLSNDTNPENLVAQLADRDWGRTSIWVALCNLQQAKQQEHETGKLPASASLNIS